MTKLQESLTSAAEKPAGAGHGGGRREFFKKIAGPAVVCAAALMSCYMGTMALAQEHGSAIGREVAIARHLQDGEEFELSIRDLILFGEKLFTAKFTVQEGAGRSMRKGTR